jgi:hypothetical protein
MTGHPGTRQRGAVLPSPVVILSIIAVAVAAVAFVATRSGEPAEREITQPAAQQSGQSESESEATAEPSATATTEPAKKKPAKPRVVRSEVAVAVFNNSGIRGLAATTSAQVGEVGWQVSGADNWYGTIPATTVYFPPGLQPAAKLLALDLGVERVMPAVAPMQMDRLTLILTGELG